MSIEDAPAANNVNRLESTNVTYDRMVAFRRLLWTEYRVQRGFWLLMVVFVLAINLGLHVTRFNFEETLATLTLSLPQLAGVLYSLGCGATLFAGENESGSIEVLRRMGVRSGIVWASKLTWGVSGLAGLVGVAAATLWISASMESLDVSRWEIAVSSFLVSLIVLLASAVSSMVCRSVFAALLSSFVLSLTLLMPLLSLAHGENQDVTLAVLSLGLLVSVIGLSDWWLRSGTFQQLLGRRVCEDRRPCVHEMPERPPFLASLREDHTSVMFAGGLLLGVGCLLWFVALILFEIFRVSLPHSGTTRWLIQEVNLWWAVLLATVLGDLPARRAQRKSTELNFDRTAAWFSRQTVLAWLIGWWFVNWLCRELPAGPSSELHHYVIPWSLLAFGVSQFSATLTGERLWSIPVAIISFVVLLLPWCALVILGEEVWWASGSTVMLMLVGSWFASRDNAKLIRVMRSSFLWLGFVVLPTALFLGLVASVRISEIPPPPQHSGTRRPEIASPDREQKLDAAFERMLRQTLPAPILPYVNDRGEQVRQVPCWQNDWHVMDGPKNSDAMTAVTREWVLAAIPAVDRQLQWLDYSRDDPLQLDHTNAASIQDLKSVTNDVVHLWLLMARHRESEGMLAEALRLHMAVLSLQQSTTQWTVSEDYYYAQTGRLRQYVRIAQWAKHSQQTVEQLRTAISEIMKESRQFPSPEILLPTALSELRQVHAKRIASARLANGDWSWPRCGLHYLCWGEAAREDRLLHWLDHGHTQTFAELRSLPLGLSNFVSVATGHTTPFSEDSKADVLAIPGSSFFTHSIQLGKLGVHYSKTPRLRSRQAARINTSGNQVGLFLQLENIRRCLLLELASAAFQHERNGQFPRTIEQLVPEYLPTAPVNCGSGQAISLWWADTSSGAVPLNGTDENSTSRILSHWSIATRNPGTVAVEINFDSVPRFVQISR